MDQPTVRIIAPPASAITEVISLSDELAQALHACYAASESSQYMDFPTWLKWVLGVVASAPAGDGE